MAQTPEGEAPTAESVSDVTAPLALPNLQVAPVEVAPVAEPLAETAAVPVEPDAVHEAPAAVEPVAVEPVAVEPVEVADADASEPEPALAHVPVAVAPVSEPAEQADTFAIAPPSTPSPAYLAAVRSTRGLRQALTVVVALSASAFVASQLLIWFAARQVAKTFERAFSIDSNGQFDVSNAEAMLSAGTVAASLAGLAALGWIVLSIVAVVLFLVWQAQANANARVITGRSARFGTAPAIVCWFVPIANLFIPWLNLNDLWNTSASKSASARTGRGVNLVVAWWLTLLVQLVLAVLNGAPSRTVELDSSPLGGLALVQTIVYLVSVVLMLLTVKGIGTSQEATPAAVTEPDWPSLADGAAPMALDSAAPSRVLVAPTTAVQDSGPNRGRVNPRDPFSWPAPQPPRSGGSTFS